MFQVGGKYIIKDRTLGLVCLGGLLLAAGFWLAWSAIEKDQLSQPPPTDNPFLLAEYYFNHGPYADGTYDLNLARQYYEEGLADNPEGDSLAWYQLGRIDFLEGRFEEALYKFGKQVELFGDSQPSVYYMIALTHGYRARMWGREDDWAQAALNFRRYLEFDPTSPWARTDLAWVYFAQGDYEAMVEPLKTGLASSPDNPWLLNMYGLALLNLGEKEAAKQSFEKAKLAADKLTIEDWGRSYPGNDPEAWARGLAEFKEAIEKNLKLAS